MHKAQVEVQKITEYSGHKGSIFITELDQAERYLYSSGDDGVVARWDLQAGETDGEGVVQVGQAVYSLLLVERHDMLVAGASNGTIYFIDLKKKQIVHTYRKREQAIYELWYDETLDTVWALQAKGALSVIQLQDFREMGYLPLSQENLRCLIPAPTKGQVLIGASDGHIRVLDKRSGTVVSNWQAHDNSVFCLLIHPQNKYLLSGGRDAHLNAWDLKTPFQSIQKIPAHNFSLNDIVLSPDQQYCLTASRDKTIKLWDADSLQLLKVIDWARHEAHRHSVNKLKWLASDNSVISCGDDRRIIRWQINVLR